MSYSEAPSAPTADFDFDIAVEPPIPNTYKLKKGLSKIQLPPDHPTTPMAPTEPIDPPMPLPSEPEAPTEPVECPTPEPIPISSS